MTPSSVEAKLESAEEGDETFSPQDRAHELIGRFRSGDCPFCGRDPYHYVDNGVGMERVAVVCCDLGIALFQDGDEHLSRASGERYEAAEALAGLLSYIDELKRERDAAVGALRPFADFCEQAERFVEARTADGRTAIFPTKHFRLAHFRAARAVCTPPAAGATDA